MKRLYNVSAKTVPFCPQSLRNIQSIFISCVVVLSFDMAEAQTEPSVALGEVQVKAERIEKNVDGWTVYPLPVQKSSAVSGYTLIRNLNFPNIRVNELERTVSAVDNRGAVQIRINGIESGMAEMLALDPLEIVRVEFVDNPGVRYGTDVAYVINLITRPVTNGSVIGADMVQGLTLWNGQGFLYGKWNRRKSEYTVSYNGDYEHTEGIHEEETAHYHLTDGTVRTVSRNDIASDFGMSGHKLRFGYARNDPGHSVFQASLSGNMSLMPECVHHKLITEPERSYKATESNDSRSFSPVIDLYYSRKLPANQSLQFNAVGTYIRTLSANSYDEGKPYVYDVKGKTASLMSEGIYEKKFKPLTLSLGLNYSQKYTENDYTGSTTAHNVMHNSRVYGFADMRGCWQKLRYAVGLGASRLHYRQGKERYNYWTFRPKLSLMYNLTEDLQLQYTFERKERVSRIAMISDVSIQSNSMESIVGSADLKPSRDLFHEFRISYMNSRLQAIAQIFYKHCHHPNMALYERTDDNLFIYTQKNQKAINVLQSMLYANYWLVPQKLSCNLSGGLFRCFNFGDSYTHCYTSYFVNGGVNAYLGDFTLSAYADNGSRHLEGESKGTSGAYSILTAGYKYRNWNFSLSYQHPFTRHYKGFESELLNRNLQKTVVGYNNSRANSLWLNVTLKIKRGRKYEMPDRTIHLKDTDTGIIGK